MSGLKRRSVLALGYKPTVLALCGIGILCMLAVISYSVLIFFNIRVCGVIMSSSFCLWPLVYMLCSIILFFLLSGSEFDLPSALRYSNETDGKEAISNDSYQRLGLDIDV